VGVSASLCIFCLILHMCGCMCVCLWIHTAFLHRALPPHARPHALSPSDYVWALHSHSQDMLIDLVFSTQAKNTHTHTYTHRTHERGRLRESDASLAPTHIPTRERERERETGRDISWERCRALGITMWLSSTSKLREIVKTIAQQVDAAAHADTTHANTHTHTYIYR